MKRAFLLLKKVTMLLMSRSHFETVPISVKERQARVGALNDQINIPHGLVASLMKIALLVENHK